MNKIRLSKVPVVGTVTPQRTILEVKLHILFKFDNYGNKKKQSMITQKLNVYSFPLHTGLAGVTGGGPGKEKVRTGYQNDQQGPLVNSY